MAVLLAAALLDAPMPNAALSEAVRDSAAIELAALAVRESLFSEGEAFGGGRAQLHFTVRSKERVRDRVRFMRGVLFHPTDDDYLWVNLPEAAWMLYPALRPVRLLGRVLRRGLGELNTQHEH